MKKFYFFLVALMLGVMSASAADYYLIGGFNGWKLKDANAKFSATATAGEYKLEYQGQLTSGFKINDGTWSNDNINIGSNGSNLEIGEPYAYSVGGSTGNIGIDIAIDNPTLLLNLNAQTLTITGEEGEMEISYDIWGNFPAASDSWASTSMENVEGNKWVAEDVEVTVTSNFGIRELTNGAQTNWIAADGTSAITGPGAFNCKLGGADFSIAPGTYTLTFDADAFILTVAGEGSDDPTPTPSVTYYMIGDFNTWTLADPAAKFTQSNENSAEFVLDYVGTLSGGFKINNGTWTDDNYNFGSNGSSIEVGVPYVYTVAGSSENIIMATDVVNPHVVLNPTTKTITITTSTAVEGVEMEENVAPVYYNLQGVRVDAPANGLYIVVRGNKVAKELVK